MGIEPTPAGIANPNSTGLAAIAAAVPTIAAINTSVANNAPSVPGWKLLQTSAPSGVSTVTFSGLAGYSKYRVEALGLAATTVNNPSITVNGDTASKYSYWSKNLNGSVWSGASVNLNANVALPTSGITICNFVLEIDKALVLSPKNFVFSGMGAGNGTFDGGALYQTTSAMTSVTVTNAAATNFTAGNIYLYGAN